MSYDSPEIPRNPGIGREGDEKDRLPCPVCKVDESIEDANRLHAKLYRKVERAGLKRAASAREKGKGRGGLGRFDGLDEFSSAQDFESHFSPKLDTFERGVRREDLSKRVACYFEVCSRCGLLWDPYAHVRKRELDRTAELMTDFLGSPVEAIATLDDEER